MTMKVFLMILGVVLFSCGTKRDGTALSTKDKYLNFDSLFKRGEIFNDSICQVATDSASRRFKRNKFELFAFLSSDSSETPIHLLADKFRLHVIGFAEKDIVFRFCFNESMISEFEREFKFNPIDSVHVIYDSLDKIGLTNIPHKFGTKDDDLVKYMVCNLEFPGGTEGLTPPYPLVEVKFRISPSGQADSIRIRQSFSKEYDSAAIKLIRMMPKWRPRRGDDGKYEPVYYIYPVRFNPTEKEKYCR